MQFTKLGKSTIDISAIGLGGMPMSIQGRPDEAQSIATIHASLDAGVNFIDTADVYCFDDSDIGHNERLIASALRERKDRDRIFVATKGGMRRPAARGRATARPRISGKRASRVFARSAPRRSFSISFTPPIRPCRWPTASARSRIFSAREKSASSG
jgi:aryl-alcohol dehydrogenase-like predicted oxidoreductase